MSESRKWTGASPRRTFLKAAASVSAGAVITRSPLWAQNRAGAGAAAFPKIDSQFMITPDRAWEWNAFKSQGGPTYAGGTGWKRYLDFLSAKMQEFGAADFDSVEIPYDHYIVDDCRTGALTCTTPAWRSRNW